MLKRRWRLWLCLTLLLLVGGAFLLPMVRWPVIGWVRGEAFYEGRPTSYWRRECQRWHPIKYGSLMATAWIRLPSWFEQQHDQLVGIPFNPKSGTMPLCRGDPLSVPVLMELLKDDALHVRWIAIAGLANVGQPARPAVPMLLEIVQDKGELQEEARHAIEAIDPKQ